MRWASVASSRPAPVGSPSPTTRSRPATGITVVRNVWQQATEAPPFLRAPLCALWHAAPVPRCKVPTRRRGAIAAALERAASDCASAARRLGVAYARASSASRQTSAAR